jgi:hypothetical protein
MPALLTPFNSITKIIFGEVFFLLVSIPLPSSHVTSVLVPSFPLFSDNPFFVSSVATSSVAKAVTTVRH